MRQDGERGYFQCMGIDLKYTAFSGSCPKYTVIKLYQVKDTEDEIFPGGSLLSSCRSGISRKGLRTRYDRSCLR